MSNRKQYGEIVRVTFRGDSVTLSGEPILIDQLDEMAARFEAHGRGEGAYKTIQYYIYLDAVDQAFPTFLPSLRPMAELFFEIALLDPDRFGRIRDRVVEYLELEYNRVVAKRRDLLRKGRSNPPQLDSNVLKARSLKQLLDYAKKKYCFSKRGRGEAFSELSIFKKFIDKLGKITPALLIELRTVIHLFLKIFCIDLKRFKIVLERTIEYLRLEKHRAIAKRKGLLEKFRQAVWEADYYARCLIDFGEPRPMPEE